ncbi:alpha/beta-hydrolase [Wolfiporia cocos MD-104 SS10]|uniref:Alpha/beta-hydrolase n=1 Tax=Wolfiporia cocos (strain MD-104) TaxID=742152 RepID=A0A2H3JIA4_WOLCO|nr:alpha/beta-hydrolase [Wolfiporia cocos MD-104 SS10]
MSGLLPSIESFAKGAFATTAGLGTVCFSLLFFGQNFLIYLPAYPPGSRTAVASPGDHGLPYQDVELRTSDNIKLRCYMFVQRKDISQLGALDVESSEDETEEQFSSRRPTVMMFHGNGGNIGHRIALAKIFYVKMRCNVFMLSYRGYGLSEGSPSEKGIQLDAQCALDYIQNHPSLAGSPIVLYGQSIGGAVSIDLTSRNPHAVRALILENTFLSLPRLVPNAFPILGPVSFLCHQKWDSASKISLIPPTTPILMLSGLQDEVVPPEHMRSLWELVQARTGGPSRSESSGGKTVHQVPSASRYAQFVEFEHGAHNDTCVQPDYWTTIDKFIKSLDGSRSASPVSPTSSSSESS